MQSHARKFLSLFYVALSFLVFSSVSIRAEDSDFSGNQMRNAALYVHLPREQKEWEISIVDPDGESFYADFRIKNVRRSNAENLGFSFFAQRNDFSLLALRQQFETAINKNGALVTELYGMAFDNPRPRSFAELQALDPQGVFLNTEIHPEVLLKPTTGTAGSYHDVIVLPAAKNAQEALELTTFSLHRPGPLTEINSSLFGMLIESALLRGRTDAATLESMAKKNIRPSKISDLAKLDPKGKVFSYCELSTADDD